MATAKTHDRLTVWAAILSISGAWAARWGWDIAVTIGMSVLVGGFFLSPDLDTHSIVYKRWGIFRWWWKPYRRLFSHRSFFSHAPLFGTLTRLLWLSPIWFPLWYWGWWQPEPKYLVAIVMGIEFAAMVHWVADLVTTIRGPK